MFCGVPGYRPAAITLTSSLLKGTSGHDAPLRPHPLDVVLARYAARSKMFSSGWGDEAFLASADYASYTLGLPPLVVDWQAENVAHKGRRRDGTFRSPLDFLPPESRLAHLRWWTRGPTDTACLALAASRDETYRAREHLFLPLVERGIDLYLLENPYYGRRHTAVGPSLATASDHALMTLATVCEARALLDWLRPHYAKLVVTGYSMGGHTSALTAARTPYPVACAPLATGASGAAIYTRGLLSLSVDFTALAAGSGNLDAARARMEKAFLPADITQYPPPLCCEAAVLVAGTRDGYVLQSETERLHRHWPGSTLHWINAGHFSALWSHRRMLRDAVLDAVGRL
jgi:pimeloyl-ACP methyl ester carboxylesterase